MMVARLVLIGAGIVAFAFALRTGTDWARFLAIGCLVAALGLRLVAKLKR